MEVPRLSTLKRKSAQGSTQGSAGGIDRKTLIKKGLLNRKESGKADSNISENSKSDLGSLSSQGDGHSKTKYQSLDKGETDSPDFAKSLLDSSFLFRSKTAIPHGLYSDILEEVYVILQELHGIYKSHCLICGAIPRSNPEMEEMLCDAEAALNRIAPDIGKDCEHVPVEEYTPSKIYADAKHGIPYRFIPGYS